MQARLTLALSQFFPVNAIVNRTRDFPIPTMTPNIHCAGASASNLPAAARKHHAPGEHNRSFCYGTSLEQGKVTDGVPG